MLSSRKEGLSRRPDVRRSNVDRSATEILRSLYLYYRRHRQPPTLRDWIQLPTDRTARKNSRCLTRLARVRFHRSTRLCKSRRDSVTERWSKNPRAGSNFSEFFFFLFVFIIYTLLGITRAWVDQELKHQSGKEYENKHSRKSLEHTLK